MKLLLDQNLSHLLVGALFDLYPEVVHVRSVGLSEGLDQAVWEFAGTHDFIIVTKDGDFSARVPVRTRAQGCVDSARQLHHRGC